MEYFAFALAIGSIYSLIAIGFALIYSILGFSNFSHGVIMGVGAYIGYFILTAGMPWYIALFCAAFGCGILGMIVEFFAFRKLWTSRGPLIYLFVASITVLMLVENILSLKLGGLILTYPAIFTGAIAVGTVNMPVSYIIIFFISMLSMSLLTVFLTKTKQGIAIRAATTELRTCSLLGIKVDILIPLVFFIAGCLGGVAGMFYGMSYSVFPQIGRIVVKGYMAAVIGGMGSLGGAVLGAFLLALLETLITFVFGSAVTPIGLFLVVIALLLLRPQGISGISREQKV